MENTLHNSRRFNVPDMVKGRAEAAGEVGLAWLNGLDTLVEELEELWQITVTHVLSGGSHAMVALADGKAGEAYVLKVDIPDGQLVRIRNRGEFIALGRGAIIDGVPVIKQEKLFVIDQPKANN